MFSFRISSRSACSAAEEQMTAAGLHLTRPGQDIWFPNGAGQISFIADTGNNPEWHQCDQGDVSVPLFLKASVNISFNDDLYMKCDDENASHQWVQHAVVTHGCSNPSRRAAANIHTAACLLAQQPGLSFIQGKYYLDWYYLWLSEGKIKGRRASFQDWDHHLYL